LSLVTVVAVSGLSYFFGLSFFSFLPFCSSVAPSLFSSLSAGFGLSFGGADSPSVVAGASFGVFGFLCLLSFFGLSTASVPEVPLIVGSLVCFSSAVG